jgi:predicted Zn-dependent peptidase
MIGDALNGTAGRLDLELRGKQGLALYSAFRNESLFLSGAVWVEVLTSPEDEARARTAVIAEFQKLARNGLAEVELAGARAAASGSRLAWLQSQTARALEYARAVVYQKPASEVDDFAEAASKITVADTKRVSGAYLRDPSAAGIVRGRPHGSTGSPSKQQ